MTADDIQNHIAARIRAFRKQQGVSQQSLADFLGKSRVTICNIEAGRQGLDSHGIYLICCALKCTPNELFPPCVPVQVAEETTTVMVVKKTKKLVYG